MQNLRLLRFCLSAFTIFLLTPNPVPADEKPPRVTVSGKAMAQTVTKKVAPAYPESARKKRIQGNVRLHIVVGTDGKVIQAQTVTGDPALARSAIEAVKQWTYKPYMQDGKAAEVDTVCEVNYSLAP